MSNGFDSFFVYKENRYYPQTYYFVYKFNIHFQ